MDGLVLTCDRDGRLQGLLSAGDGIPGLRMDPGRAFPALFGVAAVTRALDLFAALRGGEMVVDRSLEWGGPESGGREGPGPQRGMLYVSGCGDGTGFVLTVARQPGAAGLLALAIAGLDAVLAARLSPLVSSRPVPAGPATEALFEEMSRLNNELSTAQRALAKANAELAASNEQKNRLMGMLAHDLRSPLQVIAGFAELLEDRVAGRLDPTERSCLERIRESSLFMRHLVEDALSLAALEAGRLRLNRQPVDLALLARRNVAMNAVLAEGKGVAIMLEAPEGLPPAMLDSGKTEQVMNNLLSNAIKFSHRGGTVRVAVAAGEEGWQRLIVADEGRGMSEAERARLFQPFTRSGTLGTAGEGTVGLGLYICRTIVEGHGGRILVDSTPGAGATFTVELPVGVPAEA